MTTKTEEYYVDTLITHVDDKEIMWIEFKDDDSTEETIAHLFHLKETVISYKDPDNPVLKLPGDVNAQIGQYVAKYQGKFHKLGYHEEVKKYALTYDD
ncbi:hypothetical protein ABQ284_11470 [Lentilactobacillus buchneri]|uniref:hypothetical protein n=1 Tax=Lentilactobacillus buchneri TaxID=1581 RepID=UPI0030F32092